MLIDIRARQEKAQWQYLLEKIKACALKATDEDTATSLWAKEGGLPKGIDTQALETFWQQGPSEGNEEQLREACIALEIFGEIESPAGDKKARMNYQMKRLVEGMGSQQAQPEHALQNSINDFIALHPSTDWTERFCSGSGKNQGLGGANSRNYHPIGLADRQRCRRSRIRSNRLFWA